MSTVLFTEWWPRTPEPHATIRRDVLSGKAEKDASSTELAKRLQKLNSKLGAAHRTAGESARRVRDSRGRPDAQAKNAVNHARNLDRVVDLQEEIQRLTALQESA